jgi:hypothetical protein
MRVTDLACLNDPYPEGLDPTEADAMAALGIKLANWTALENEVFADFTEEPPYGIGWWAPNPGTKRRILISDQLYCCLTSVASNMTEAALHRLEYLGASERDNARLADAVKLQGGVPRIVPPRARSPYEQLTPGFMRMHEVGVIRALASALDCLAGVVIGVAALPQSILKADFGKARRKLQKIDGSWNVGENIQAFAVRLETAIADAGPRVWLDWTLDFRNMLVHRGRRLEHGSYRPIEPIRYGPNGYPRARRASHLPRDPGRSDVEVFLDTRWNFVLHEDEQQTLEGLVNSTGNLLEMVATELFELWRWRRAHAADLRQPADQWPEVASTESRLFNGYAPGSINFNPDNGSIHPITARRLRAAALDDSTRPQWMTFD